MTVRGFDPIFLASLDSVECRVPTCLGGLHCPEHNPRPPIGATTLRPWAEPDPVQLGLFGVDDAKPLGAHPKE